MVLASQNATQTGIGSRPEPRPGTRIDVPDLVAYGSDFRISGILLEYLVGLAVGNETLGYRIVSYALDVTLVGCAVVWAIAGAIVATWEAFTSVKNVVSRPRD